MSTPNGPYQPYQPQGPQFPPPYPQHQVPKGKSWPRRHPVLSVVLAGLAALFVAAGVAGSHQKTPAKDAAAKASTAASRSVTARSYGSARALLAALDAGGARCRGADFPNSTVVGAAGNIADCSGASDGDTALAVFTSHRTAEAYATGIIAQADEPDGSPTAVVVGPDWAVNTSPIFSGRVVRAVGGTVITGHPSPAAPAVAPTTQAPAPSPTPPAEQTVTYVVTGSYAQVSYGPAGSSDSGSVPMDVTQPLGSPLYYAINAQLQGGGSVSCEIEVDGQVVSQSSASGGYNIAQCEISQDPLTGGWQDTNGG